MPPSAFALSLFFAQAISAVGSLLVLLALFVAPPERRPRTILMLGSAGLAGCACALYLVGRIPGVQENVHVPYFQLVPLVLALFALELIGYAFMRRAVARRTAEETAKAESPTVQ